MELQVRDARVTDVDRITALLAPDDVWQDVDRDASTVADLLRQLVYLPNATIIVALNGREGAFPRAIPAWPSRSLPVRSSTRRAVNGLSTGGRGAWRAAAAPIGAIESTRENAGSEQNRSPA